MIGLAYCRDCMVFAVRHRIGPRQTMDKIIALVALFVFFAGLWWLVRVARNSNKIYTDDLLPLYRENLQVSREQLALSRETIQLQTDALAATREQLAVSRDAIQLETEVLAALRELIMALREKH